MMDRKQRLTLMLLPTFLCIGVAGCEDEAVRVYQVPKPEVIDPTAGRFRHGPHEHHEHHKPPTPTTEAPDAPEASPGQMRITYTVPEGWAEQPTGSTMRVAAFTMGYGDDLAELTVIPLPVSVFNVTENVNRWAGQIGVAARSPDDIARLVRDFDKVPPYRAYEVDITGESQRIFGIMVVRGEWVWFYKMSGPVDLVGEQIDAAREFVAGVRYEGQP